MRRKPEALRYVTILYKNMAKQNKRAGFSTLTSKFPKGTLPIELTPDAVREFEKKNKPLSVDAISQFLLEEGEAIDEFTEFIPCFRLPDTKDFYGFIYWQAGLMEYHYWLATFDKKGNFIEKKRIGGTITQESTFKVSVANITSSWKIEVKEGESDRNTKNLTPTSFSQPYIINISLTGTMNEF